MIGLWMLNKDFFFQSNTSMALSECSLFTFVTSGHGHWKNFIDNCDLTEC